MTMKGEYSRKKTLNFIIKFIMSNTQVSICLTSLIYPGTNNGLLIIIYNTIFVLTIIVTVTKSN